jgi:NDP-sugar pyrophosphorylase family protein
VAHRQSGAIATIAAHRRNVYIDFGVIETHDGLEVAAYLEKPTQQSLVSLGMYVFEPEVVRFIQAGKKLDFPDLVQRLLQAKAKLALYPSTDFWLDIGRPDDYQKAIEVFAQQREMFLDGSPLPGTL